MYASSKEDYDFTSIFVKIEFDRTSNGFILYYQKHQLIFSDKHQLASLKVLYLH